jgi:hypothetical protein
MTQLFFNEVGMAEGHDGDRRLVDPAKFAHLRQEPGIDSPTIKGPYNFNKALIDQLAVPPYAL